jgi:Tol biopolymer transport system component
MLRFTVQLRALCVSGGVGVVLLIMLGVASSAQAAFPGNNGLLAVEPLSGTGLILATSSGAREHRICTDVQACGHPDQVQWSPDGRSLVFVAAKQAGAGAGPLRDVAADGSCVNCQFGSARAPAFEPGGTRVSFLSGRTLRADGVDGLPVSTIKLAIGGAVLTDAVWSADGELAVVAGGHIWIDSQTGQGRSIGLGSAPSWAPGGSRLALVRHGWIWIINRGTGHGIRLVRGNEPAFSPDGGSVAFIGAQHQVDLIRSTGGPVRRVGSLTGRSVNWQPVPSGKRACQLPVGATQLSPAGQTLVYATSASSPSYGTKIAVSSCLAAQGFPRLLTGALGDDDFGDNDSPTTSGVSSVAVNGSHVALLEGSQTSHDGLLGQSVDLYDAATGSEVPDPTAVSVDCDLGAAEYVAPQDDDVDPASTCGIQTVVMGPNGDYAVLVTSYAIYSDCGATATAGASYNCWSQAVIEHTASGDTPVASIVMDAPIGGSGLTDLTIKDSTLTWDRNGSPQSAQLK